MDYRSGIIKMLMLKEKEPGDELRVLITVLLSSLRPGTALCRPEKKSIFTRDVPDWHYGGKL